MNEAEFIARFEEEKGMLKAWGGYVSSIIRSKLKKELGEDFHDFLKIEPKPRVKELNSALHKAFIVKKDKYKDPYEEMEDKVGVRFVVLLGSHVDRIGRIIEGLSLWNTSKDVDFERRRAEAPYHFDKYQSLHYVVKANKEFKYQGRKIAKGTPCEIQVRTLLQHAHSELTHDSFYKPSSENWRREEKTVERLVARGMALVETTDALFEDVIGAIMKESEETERWIDNLTTLYRNHIGRNFDRDALSNQLIVDAYLTVKPTLSFDDVKAFFDDNSAYVERIRERVAIPTYLYRLPAILLAYFIAKRYKHLAKTHWPLTEQSLEDIFTDVGHSL
jgi:putative GTP pyrophosphokinase